MSVSNSNLTLQQRVMCFLSSLNNGQARSREDLHGLIREMLDAGWNNPPSHETRASQMPDGLFIHQQGMGWVVNASYLREQDARALYDALSGSLKAAVPRFECTCLPSGRETCTAGGPPFWTMCKTCGGKVTAENGGPVGG